MAVFSQILCFSFVLFIGLSAGERHKSSENTSLQSVFKFRQNDYKLVHHRIELVSYNKSIVTNVSVGFYLFNRTTRAFNMTKTVMANFTNVKVHVQLYKFLSNEYRYFPVEFEFDLCTAWQEDLFDLRSVNKCGNMADSCTYLKGHVYRICNYVPDSTKFPPQMPTGAYKADLDFKTKGIYYLRLAWFGSVVEISEWN